MSSNSPIPPTRLRQIATDACDSALSSTSAYDHSLTQTWNESIVNKTLQALISESNTGEGSAKWKFVVNSTIIQHLSDARPAGSSSGVQTGSEDAETAESAGSGSEGGKLGRRGMHSASGAYWNNERDGMWSCKYSGAEGKGMDVVVNVVWIGA